MGWSARPLPARIELSRVLVSFASRTSSAVSARLQQGYLLGIAPFGRAFLRAGVVYVVRSLFHADTVADLQA